MESKTGNTSTSSLMSVLIVITLLAVGSTYYFYSQYQKSQKLLKDPNAISQQQTAEIRSKLSKFIVLPDEAPTIATITDIKQLQNQAFFRNGKNGDKLIIFPKAKKAILWRPSTNLIIETAPVNIGTPASQTTPAPTTKVVSPAVSPAVSPTVAK